MSAVLQLKLQELTQDIISTQLSPEESSKALQLLFILLQQSQASWPTLDLIRCHAKLSRSLREAKSFGDEDDVTRLVKDTAQLIKGTYQSLGDFVPFKNEAALRTTCPGKYISHRYLREFVSQFALPVDIEGERKPVVTIALPNGPLLAAVCIAVTAQYIAAPINPSVGPQQFQADVLQAGAKCILTTSDDYAKLELEGGWTHETGIVVLLVDVNDDMNIMIRTPDGTPISSVTPALPNAADDIALILFTSGTSGKKKVVPITTHSIVAGVAFVIDSWALTFTDVCLNMMPLYHVGGLIRNIFAPIFSGGSTICCPTFDPNCFWDMVETTLPTWYYASPSMHSLILAESANRAEALQKNKVRLVCNAAGGLLPSLAVQLQNTFDCVVLPSYGMTECMPISTPPVDYKLDRPGTSGISIGPELAIFDSSCDSKQLSSGTVGRICVRGEPLFAGYLQPDGRLDRSALDEYGWFDTGDMGYMDDDGYLYITGRSKEVINRGGELISPFEVENAILAASVKPKSSLHGRVTQALAFSVQHDVLQEVVGVVLVTPKGVPRPDLRLLHRSLKPSLQQVKWPTLIVYMDDLPKKNNKVLRIKLAERLSLPQLTDDTAYLARHWQGVCPKPETELSIAIECSRCSVNLRVLWKEIACMIPDGSSFCIRMNTKDRTIRVIFAPSGTDRLAPDSKIVDHVRSRLDSRVHGYFMPQKMQILQVPLPDDGAGNIDDVALQRYLAEVDSASAGDLSSVEGKVTQVFASVLGVSASDILPDADFFDLGGDSLKAGKLLSMLRSDFNVHISIDAIFQHSSTQALSAFIREKQPDDRSSAELEDPFLSQRCEQTYSSTRPLLMAVQLLPICIFYPMRRAYQWTAFVLFLSMTQSWDNTNSVPGRLVNLTISILVARLVTKAVVPWIGILAKWALIGRYREGLYPMWGPYHTRWWLVQKIVDICGHGVFAQTNYTSILYLRLMGAKIGKNVSLKGVQTGEWDLIEIEDNAVLERCTIRPFAGERNTTMYLGRVHVGRNATVGVSSIVAPGTSVPEDACIGPNSSSWEVNEAADEANRDLLLSKIPGAHWVLEWFVTQPLVILGWIVSLMPWFVGLIGLVISEPNDTKTPLFSILMWFAATNRVGYHYLALVLRVSLSPIILFGFALVLKWTLDAMFGPLKPSTTATGRCQIENWRMSLMKAIFSAKRLHDMTELFGQHYEPTSIAIRMLGGRVGGRVYWPGTGPSIGDYHLLNIGNDVVFGSRAHLVTSDGIGSEAIKVEDHAMIADRVTLLPGVVVGVKTTMGSGALTRRNKHYPDGGTYVGSKKGDALCLCAGTTGARRHVQTPTTDSGYSSKKDTEANEKEIAATANTEIKGKSKTEILNPDSASPFGRAFYLKQAPYRVYGMTTIIAYSFGITVFTAFYWNVPSISAIQLVAVIFREQHHILGRQRWFDVPVLYLLFLVFIAFLTAAQTALATGATIAAKWYLLGRRRPGNYDWDKSPYCQNWQLYLTVEKLRRYCFRGHGILGMLTGTHWLVLYFRALGADIGDDCALFANGRPSLMFTEPDLISVGDRTVIDDASVVAHINTRGKFDLNRLEIGKRCVMRTGSRLLSGAVMRDDSALLEHTLVMGGDVVEKGWTMQGWPAERFRGPRVTYYQQQQEQGEEYARGDGVESSTATSSRLDLSSVDGEKRVGKP